MPQPTPSAAGRVYFVGAGPGDPGLLTLRGWECLRRAEVILYDYLVNPQLLEHATPACQQVCLGRHGQGRLVTQSEIHDQMIAAARAGRMVVRLKSGDPMIFAHAAEEMAALDAAGIPFEIVPGITTALAVGSYAGIPLTDRQSASSVALVTAREGPDKSACEALDYAALAAFPGTLVFYMGVTTARQWTQSLIGAGKSPDTPAAVVWRCSWPNQRRFRCTLATVAETIEVHHLRPPVIAVVGEVAAALDLARDWFAARPLFGRRVLVARPRHQAAELRALLAERGAEVLVHPAIEIGPPSDWRQVDAALDALNDFDWLVFSSANGVQAFFSRLAERGRDLRALGTIRLAAIGPGTAAELARWHLRADLQPNEFRAEALASALLAAGGGDRYLLARASRGRDLLRQELEQAGGTVREIVVYQSTDVAQADPLVAEQMAEGEIDWVAVTSSAIARSLARLFGDRLARTRLASISPVTSATLAELGLPPAAEARTYTMAGLVECILAAEGGGASPAA